MRRRAEDGQVTLLIIGFATILIMVVVVVTNASAVYLQRQGLTSLADGAALQGADLGARGVYDEGLPADRLDQRVAEVRAAVQDYLSATGAHRRFPGIQADVRVDTGIHTVTVSVRAPLDLPLQVPGTPASPQVSATSTAVVRVLH